MVSLAGDYVLLVTNQENGCTATDQVNVVEDIELPNNVLINITEPSCHGENDGSIHIDTVFGDNHPYLFGFGNDPYFNDNNEAIRLTAGNYLVNIQDIDGCEWDTLITITDPTEVILDLGDDLTLDLGDSIQLLALSNIPLSTIDTFIWSNTNFLNCLDCFDPISTPIESISYSAQIIDENGCTAKDQLRISVLKKRFLYIPNTFSPNGDGKNDLFLINGGKDVAIIRTFKIFDRWGEVMFEQNNFAPNHPDNGWDGKLNGQALNPAVFPYYAEVEFLDGKVEIYQGDMTLIR